MQSKSPELLELPKALDTNVKMKILMMVVKTEINLKIRYGQILSLMLQ